MSAHTTRFPKVLPLRAAPAGLALVAGLVLAPAAAGQERVGDVALASGQVTSTLAPAPAARLATGDDLFLDARIETARRSKVKMAIDPDGSTELGESSILVLDRTEIDEITGRQESFVTLLRGWLRLVLSPGTETDLTVDTPTSTTGVKGTDVRFAVAPGGETVIAVWEGEVTVTAKAGGPPLVLRAGLATVVSPGQGPTPPAFIDPEGQLAGRDRPLDPGDPLLPVDLGDLPVDRGARGNPEEVTPR